ncbi:MAG: DNA/RNA nuclease SfsA [Clostridiales bacterium]|nr:DNA/RNA nuclease SfsA [Clostridiales bacterium]
MIYSNIRSGIFIARPNRFIAEVELDGRTEICHVKNTGRCRELLIPGVKVYVNQADNPARATKYDLVSVYKDGRLINIDSQAPNKVFLEYLQAERLIAGLTSIRAEAKYSGSRFDYYAEAENRGIFIEIKGVTLEEGGVALFPDAPTQRGVKHLSELAACIDEGYEARIVFVIQMCGVRYFTPNRKMHPAFGEALSAAARAGVKVSAWDCDVTKDSLTIRQSVPIRYSTDPDRVLSRRPTPP